MELLDIRILSSIVLIVGACIFIGGRAVYFKAKSMISKKRNKTSQ